MVKFPGNFLYAPAFPEIELSHMFLIFHLEDFLPPVTDDPFISIPDFKFSYYKGLELFYQRPFTKDLYSLNILSLY